MRSKERTTQGRGPDQRQGVTAAEIARMSGAVSRPTAQALAITAGVPGNGVRRGISPANGRRMAMALSVGLLNAVSARAIANDPKSFLAAMHELHDLVEEIIQDQEAAAAITAA
ncbi:hypothetical protein [Streptomyces sp. CB03238]|uniref:hypothetical protein n=1 Tax=Streptomyces sp. CB03238 TaxID=1907777 RepID=UPI00117BE64E|nr:hypothetical protein [Streptomyces sp. CB03238]